MRTGCGRYRRPSLIRKTRGIDGPERVTGPIRGIIDSALKIWTCAIQRADGRIALEPEPPEAHIVGDGDAALNFDQARELAAPLLPRATLEVTVKSGTPSLPKTR